MTYHILEANMMRLLNSLMSCDCSLVTPHCCALPYLGGEYDEAVRLLHFSNLMRLLHLSNRMTTHGSWHLIAVQAASWYLLSFSSLFLLLLQHSPLLPTLLSRQKSPKQTLVLSEENPVWGSGFSSGFSFGFRV